MFRPKLWWSCKSSHNWTIKMKSTHPKIVCREDHYLGEDTHLRLEELSWIQAAGSPGLRWRN